MNTHNIILGDAIAGMRTLPDACIQTCITSPPYWGLRDYGHTDQLGAEKTPEAYVENMVNVFREVRRILRDDGTVWLNLGDSYWSNTLSRKDPVESMWGNRPASDLTSGRNNIPTVNKRGGLGAAPIGIKPKDLVGIPWRVAFALQADGWYLRQDIIWHKPNPMPEPVTDRCTKAHEYIFLLSKNEQYYYDNISVKEPYTKPMNRWGGEKLKEPKQGFQSMEGDPYVSAKKERDMRPDKNGRNRRSVWTVTTKPFRGAHFATFPKDLIEPCVLAGTSQHGCCSKCGASHARIIERGDVPNRTKRENTLNVVPGRDKLSRVNSKEMKTIPKKTIGWEKTCKCVDAEVVPCTVFDPFTGSGTTAIVAMNHGRNFIGTELNPEYIKIAEARIADEVPTTLQEFII